jgi:hypothetical protein
MIKRLELDETQPYAIDRTEQQIVCPLNNKVQKVFHISNKNQLQ